MTLTSSRRRGNTGDVLVPEIPRRWKKILPSLGWGPASFDFQEMCCISELLPSCLPALLPCREKALFWQRMRRWNGWLDHFNQGLLQRCFSALRSCHQTPHWSLMLSVCWFSDSTPQQTLWAYHTPKNMFIWWMTSFSLPVHWFSATFNIFYLC